MMTIEPCRILIADDHELAYAGLSLLLKGTDCELVGLVKTGAEVVPFVQSMSIDIVILDFGLPDVHGLSVLAELVAITDSKVIILTGSDSTTDFMSAINFGARAVISKSDSMDSMSKAIATVQAGEIYFSQKVQQLIEHHAQPPIKLTPRQMAILHFLIAGESNKEIGYRLQISAPTVSFHLKEMRIDSAFKQTRRSL